VIKPEETAETNVHVEAKEEKSNLVDDLFGGGDEDAPKVPSMRRRRQERD